jgi:hypothetical protein
MKDPKAWIKRSGRGSVVVLASLVAIALLTALGLVLALWSYPNDPPSRFALAGLALGGGAFLLAVSVGVVAVLAYRQAVQRPELSVDFIADPRGKLPLRLTRESTEPPGWSPEARSHGYEYMAPINVGINIENTGEVTASNIVLQLSLFGLSLFPVDGAVPNRERWIPTEIDPLGGWRVIQWEGGADRPIHGYGDGRLFRFRLEHLALLPSRDPMLVLTVVADSYPRRVFTCRCMVESSISGRDVAR